MSPTSFSVESGVGTPGGPRLFWGAVRRAEHSHSRRWGSQFQVARCGPASPSAGRRACRCRRACRALRSAASPIQYRPTGFHAVAGSLISLRANRASRAPAKEVKDREPGEENTQCDACIARIFVDCVESYEPCDGDEHASCPGMAGNPKTLFIGGVSRRLALLAGPKYENAGRR